MNANQKELKLLLGGAPDTRLMSLARDNPFDDPDTSRLVLIYIVVITILLLVPAINLSGITLSRMRRRMQEIGVRRAFGATRGELLRQVLAENLVVTLMGGVLGLILSYIAVLCMRDCCSILLCRGIMEWTLRYPQVWSFNRLYLFVRYCSAC